MKDDNPLAERYRREAPDDADVVVHPSDRAWRVIERLQRDDPARAKVLWESLRKLYHQKYWPPGNPNSSLRIATCAKDAQGYRVYKFRGDHKHLRGFFRLVRDKSLSDLPVVLIDDISTSHDDEEATLRAVLNRPIADEDLKEVAELASDLPVEPDERSPGPLPGRLGTRYRQLLDVPYEDIENAITWAHSSANIVPTPEQIDSIWGPDPILINGQAGTGKTSMLAIRAAWIVRKTRQVGAQARILCTAYSKPVVDLLRANVKDAVLYKLREEAGPEQDGACEFQTFPDVLLGLMEEGQRQTFSSRENRVGFGRFNREFFQVEKRYGRVGSDVNAEFVWYAIRCFLKGYGEERILTVEDFGSVDKEGVIPKKLTRELSREELAESIRIFSRYAHWLRENGLYDDIDLARAAWARVKDQPPHCFDEIYLDEAQDLTRVEFKVLVALLNPESDIPANGFRIALAGDPQQTIHPTGFNWTQIRALFYQGEKVLQTDLRINQRTPQPIVNLANAIQRRRTHYGMEALVEQEAREQSGRLPACYHVDSARDDAVLVNLLKNPRPGTALVIWAEDDQEILQLLKEDRHLSRSARDLLGDEKVDELLRGGAAGEGVDVLLATLRLHTVSDIKGLEFERVLFYKIASSPRFAKFANETVDDVPVGKEFHSRIPILYHLNRLYVAVTRSTRHLFILDEPSAVDAVWSRFVEIDISRRSHLDGLQDDPALAPDDRLDWVGDAKRYLVTFREERDPRWLVYALDCLQRARENAEARALLVEVRAEIKEQEAAAASRKGMATAPRLWKEAGESWDQNPVFFQNAARCFVEAEVWPEVRRVLGSSSKRSPTHEAWYLYSELQVGGRDGTRGTAQAYLDFLDLNRKVPQKEEWIDYLSGQLKRHKLVDGLTRLHEGICWSGNRNELKHPILLAQALKELNQNEELVRFIDRRELHRQLWGFYLEASSSLARAAEKDEKWGEAGRKWKAIAQHAAEETESTEMNRNAANAFIRAAHAGAAQHWSDAASCYGHAGLAFSRERIISEGEAAARTGSYLAAMKSLATALPRDWGEDGPLAAWYPNSKICERIVLWSKEMPPANLAADQEAVSALVSAHLILEQRPEAKELLRRLLTAATNGARVAIHRKLGALEEEDQEYGPAIGHFEEANDYDRAWSLARKHAEALTAGESARIEGRFLAAQYERQRDPSRKDADRAIGLLREAGDLGIVRRLEDLRVAREKDLQEKVRLMLSGGEGVDPFLAAVGAANSFPLDPHASEVKVQLLRELGRHPEYVEQAQPRIRAGLESWIRDAALVLPAKAALSSQEWGVVVECAQDDLTAKEFLKSEAQVHDWARAGFRRVMGRIRLEIIERTKSDERRAEYVSALESELSAAERAWAEGKQAAQARSSTDAVLMRRKLESENVARLRERWKKAGIPGATVASKELLVEGYLAYWIEGGVDVD